MTGFGRGLASNAHITARTEISSVNRKQGEVVVQMPRGYNDLEQSIRKQVLTEVSRGRINVSIQLERPEGSVAPVKIDLPKAQALEAAFTQLSDALDRKVVLEANDFLRIPELITYESPGESAELYLPAIQESIASALERFSVMRLDEGAHLKSDLEQRLIAIETLLTSVEDIAPKIPTHHREVLLKRLSENDLELDPNDERVVKEVALFAERCDITEEITRLHSHIKKFRELINSNEPSGRPLDFLCQELNREFNTIASKANNAGLAQTIVSAKAELEKIREQVQNVE